MKKKFFTFIFICFMLAFTAPVFGEPARVLYSSETNYPPYKYQDEGYLTGFDIEMTRMIFDNNYRIIFNTGNWANVYKDLKEGSIDTCGMLAVLDSRKKDILYSKVIFRTYLAFYGRTGTGHLNTNLLKNYSIGVGEEQYSESVLVNKFGITHYTTYKTVEEAVDALARGKVDLILENQDTVNYFLIQKGYKSRIEPKLTNQYPTEIAYGISKNKPELVAYINHRVDELRKSGVYEELYEKYFLAHSDYYKRQQRNTVIAASCFIAACLLVLFIFMNLYIRLLKRKIEYERNFLESIFKNASIIIIVWDSKGFITKVNRFAERIMGYEEKELIGMKFLDLPFSEECRKTVMETFAGVINGGQVYNHDCRIIMRNGKPVDILWNNGIQKDKKGEILYGVSMGIDITDRKLTEGKLIESYQELEATHEELVATQEELKGNYDELYKLAYYDSLTGLPNRIYLMEQFKSSITDSRRKKQNSALFFLDMDNFKTVNDTLGHHYGDILLKNVGELLEKCTRKGDTVARLGGDEFIILVNNIKKSEDLTSTAEKILDIFRRPWKLDAREFHITASIGITVYPYDGQDFQTLLKNADTAMYRAKELGKNGYQLFSNEMNVRLQQRINIEEYLRHAVEREELEVYYQPVIDLENGRVVGAEALVRWNHPQNGLLYPDDFIQIAEEIGLISQIGNWVLSRACEKAAEWQKAGYGKLVMSVNISTRQFMSCDLEETVKKVLGETGLEPQYLQLEITESAALNEVEYIVGVLSRLREAGVSIALDDFGTGYSSLNYLKQLPISTLKIDKAFLNNITGDASQAAIARTVITLAHQLSMNVNAEGVETGEQLAFLQAEGCERAQGYLFGKPVPGKDFPAFFDRNFPEEQAATWNKKLL